MAWFNRFFSFSNLCSEHFFLNSRLKFHNFRVSKQHTSGLMFQKHFSRTDQKTAPVHVLPRDALVRPEVGREPRGVQPFLCIAWFASIDTMGPAFFSASEHRGLRNCINSPLILTFLVQKSCHNYEKWLKPNWKRNPFAGARACGNNLTLFCG